MMANHTQLNNTSNSGGNVITCNGTQQPANSNSQSSQSSSQTNQAQSLLHAAAAVAAVAAGSSNQNQMLLASNAAALLGTLPNQNGGGGLIQLGGNGSELNQQHHQTSSSSLASSSAVNGPNVSSSASQSTNTNSALLDLIMCKLVAPYHVVNDPRLLECGSSACYQCIISSKDSERNIKCPYCNGVHKVPADSNKLVVNKNLQNFLKVNYRHMNQNFSKQLEDSMFALERNRPSLNC
jgi:hypothetical protein